VPSSIFQSPVNVLELLAELLGERAVHFPLEQVLALVPGVRLRTKT